MTAPKSVKVILVGDIHAMDKPPKNATDTYMDDIITMLMWIADYAKKHRIKTVIWAGDVFHHKKPSWTSHGLVLRMIQVVQYYKGLGIDLRVVIGNHDITNDRLDSIEKQPLGVLIEAGLKELNGWHEDASLPIFGVPWRQDWTTNEDAAKEAFADWRLDAFPVADPNAEFDTGKDIPNSLAVTHAPIYPPGEAEKQMFTLVPTMGEHGISEAMLHNGYLYYGHIHEDHGIFEVEGVTYANMGAISRGSMTEYNIERQIKIAVWDSVKGFTEVVVPHKPAAEVFKIEAAQEAKAATLSLDAFLAEVGTSTLDVSSTGSVIEHIKNMPAVEPRIKKRAIEIVESVNESA